MMMNSSIAAQNSEAIEQSESSDSFFRHNFVFNISNLFCYPLVVSYLLGFLSIFFVNPQNKV